MSAGSRILDLVGGALLLAGGAIHTWLAFDGYGTTDLQRLFFVNGAASAAVTAAILLTRNPVPVLGGVGVAGVSLAALGLSRVGNGVVGFRGTGLEPLPEVPLTLVVEVLAMFVLGTILFRRRTELLSVVRQADAGSTGAQRSQKTSISVPSGSKQRKVT